MSENKKVCSICPFERLFSFFRESEAKKHLINARREFLLMFRSLIDQEVERLEKKTGKGTAKKVDIK
ncbi:MAG: hypothetical protein DRG25_02605 [Deltaproteobacteria bacterium]|nr:MAG: hypothetical protein DRG25_02605 [Deltaproteobacteria bacterium]